jgi:DNA-binding Xre family transcriptional regulator
MPFLELRAWRKHRHRTQRWLRAETGVSVTTISNIETGKTKGVDFDTLAKLAAALGVQPGDLFTAPPDAPKPAKRTRAK